METIVETTTMSTKGQIIIPKHTRKFTHAEKNTLFTVMPLDRDTIILRRLNKQKIVKEFRGIRKTIKDKLSEEEINEIVHKVR